MLKDVVAEIERDVSIFLHVEMNGTRLTQQIYKVSGKLMAAQRELIIIKLEALC